MDGFKKGGKFGAKPKGRSPGTPAPVDMWTAKPDPTYDRTRQAKAQPVKAAEDYAPQPERAQRKSFGVGEGDQ